MMLSRCLRSALRVRLKSVRLATMGKPPKEIELEPDAWERFERAVKVVAKSPPQHRSSKAKRKSGKTPANAAKPPKH
jgi:hypothetical protein